MDQYVSGQQSDGSTNTLQGGHHKQLVQVPNVVHIYLYLQWRILGGGATDAPRSKFFHFHAAFGIHTFCKIIGWRTHLGSWRTSPREIRH